MSEELPKLELEKVLQSEAAEIVAAREKALLIHRTRDIDAAGDEVERAVRKVIRRKLPAAYYVGHGHVVDSQVVTSPQLDVIIADNTGAPVLFRAESGTEYFPYESVYAIGEVKSTYYKGKNYVRKFVETLARIRSDLRRDETPPTYLGAGIKLGAGLSTNTGIPYRNPLFSFMLFVSSSNLQISHIMELYASKPASELPNVLCFLDKGVVVNAKVLTTEGGHESLGSINIIPEFSKEAAGESNHWVFIPFGTDDNRLGANFGFLYFALVTHLKSCVLMAPNMLDYLNRVFSYEEGSIIA
jgi:hypothetical protein